MSTDSAQLQWQKQQGIINGWKAGRLWLGAIFRNLRYALRAIRGFTSFDRYDLLDGYDR